METVAPDSNRDASGSSERDDVGWGAFVPDVPHEGVAQWAVTHCRARSRREAGRGGAAHGVLAHELRIKEVEGKVISNNRHANGAFAILYAGSHADNTKGGVDVHKYDTDGIVVRRVDATNSVMRNLTVELLDRTGKPAHFGRLHLWFKILATHG